MHESELRHETQVGEVRVERLELQCRDHAFVDQGAAGQRREVDLQLALGALAQPDGLAVQRNFADRFPGLLGPCALHVQLLDVRHGRAGQRADLVRAHRDLAPAEDGQALLLRSASRASVMMSWPAVPRSVATMARPQASRSSAGLYRPCDSGTRPNREKGGFCVIRPSSRNDWQEGTTLARWMYIGAATRHTGSSHGPGWGLPGPRVASRWSLWPRRRPIRRIQWLHRPDPGCANRCRRILPQRRGRSIRAPGGTG